MVGSSSARRTISRVSSMNGYNPQQWNRAPPPLDNSFMDDSENDFASATNMRGLNIPENQERSSVQSYDSLEPFRGLRALKWADLRGTCIRLGEWTMQWAIGRFGIIEPQSTWKQLWDWVILLLVVYNSVRR